MIDTDLHLGEVVKLTEELRMKNWDDKERIYPKGEKGVVIDRIDYETYLILFISDFDAIKTDIERGEKINVFGEMGVELVDDYLERA